MTFGERLKEIRLDKGMSQEEFAAILGTSKQVVSRYENNQRSPKVSVVDQYARKLGVDISCLLDRQEKPSLEKNENRLSEEEKVLLNLFRLVPSDRKQYILGLIEGALRSSGLLK